MSQESIRILLIEDNPGDVRLIQENLSEVRDIDFQLEYTDRLAVGLEYLARGGIDVVLLDLSLPDSFGLGTIEKVHFHDLTVPIVVLTSIADEEYAITSVRKGAQDFLIKGEFDSVLLGRIMRYAIERKRTELELKETRDAAQTFNRELTASNQLLGQAIENARRMAEIAAMASQAKSDFLANVSHEIRTPMNVILGMTELLQETPLGDRQQEYVHILKTAGESLLDLISDVLDLSKIEAGQLELEIVPFDLIQIIRDVVDIFGQRAGEKKLELELKSGLDMSRFFKGDPVRLKQILINLVGNAIKFTDHGYVTVAVTVEEKKSKTRGLRFSVTDTGIGISPEKFDAIFDSFTQADSTTTRKYGGTGLGLTISKRLVEMMEGTIRVESEPGKGSTFSFTISLPEVDAASLSVWKEPEQLITTIPETVSPVRILLVDDSEDNRKLMQFYLEKTPHTLQTVGDGQAAVETFKGTSFDLVLMDMQMPVMDGYAATREIRQWESQQKIDSTPVVALTASALKGDAEKSLAAGCNMHLTKPIKKKRLLDVIATMSGQSVSGEDISGNSQNVEVRSDETEADSHGRIVVTIDADLKELIPGYLANRRKDIKLIRESLAAGDYESLRLKGHSMIGSGSSYGFHEISRIGRLINSAAKKQDNDRIRKSFDELISYLERLNIVYK